MFGINTIKTDLVLTIYVQDISFVRWITQTGTVGSFNLGSPVNITVVAVSSEASAVTYSISAGSLPASMTLDAASGQIAGIAPSLPLTQNLTLRATNGVGKYADLAISLIFLNKAPVWQSPAGSIGSGQGGSYFATTVLATDPNNLPIIYTLTSGALPGGLALNPVTGTITGSLPILTANTVASFTITASNGTYSTAKTFSISVLLTQSMVWACAAGSLGTDVQGRFFHAVINALTYQANAGLTYALTSGSLPPGLTLNAATGTISGTLPAVSVDTLYPFGITATAGSYAIPGPFSITTLVDDSGIDPYANAVVLLMHMDVVNNQSNAVTQTFVDLLNHSIALPAVSAPVNTRDAHLFGSGAAYFNGAATLVVTGGAEFDLSQSNFTIEFYALPAESNSGPVPLLCLGNTAVSASATQAGGLDLYYDGAANLVASYRNAVGAISTASFAWAMPYGVWSHIALVYNAPFLSAFASGVLLGSVDISAGFAAMLPTQVILAANQNSAATSSNATLCFAGIVDELRLTRAARYAQSFALPTRPSPNVPVWTASSVLPASVSGVAYEASVVATQADGHVLSYAASNLPAGLTINASLGVINGIAPVTPSDTVYAPTLLVSDGYNQVSKIFSLTNQHHLPPVWLTPAGTLGTYVAASLVDVALSVSSPQNLALSVSVLSGQLPPGLSVGVSGINGTAPAESGTASFSFSLLLSDGFATAVQDFSITIERNQAPIWISNAALLTAYEGSTVNLQLVAIDPLNQNLTYNLVGGSLPTGLTLTTAGTLYGTLPTVANTTSFGFTVRATNQGGLSADQAFSIIDQLVPSPSWITPNGSLGSYLAVANSIALSFAGTSNIANVAASITLATGTLPPGLSLASANGTALISGIANAVSSNTTYYFTLQLSNGQIAVDETFLITIDANHGIIWNSNAALGLIEAGLAYHQVLSATSLDLATPSYALTAGSLPAGLALANGVITGIPAPVTANIVAVSSFTITASNPVQSNAQSFSLGVFSAIPVWVTAPGSLGIIYDNAAYATVFVANSTSPLSYALTAGSLPTGLSLAANGVLSGVPIAVGTYGFTITASDGINAAAQSYTAVFVQAGTPLWNTVSPTNATAFVGYAFQLSATDPNHAALSYLLTAGSLPAGLTLTSAGLITGTPSPVAATTVSNFTVTVTNGMESAQQSFSLTVLLNNALSWITPSGVIGNAVTTTVFSYQLLVSNASVNPTSFAITAGTFPSTLSLSNSGLITGDLPAVTTNTSYGFTVTANNIAQTVSEAFSIIVLADTPVWTTPSGSLGSVGASTYFSTTIAAASPLNINEITFMVVAGALPTGLALVNGGNNTATIAGYMPDTTTNMVYGFTISASTPSITINRSFSLTVLASPIAFMYPAGVLNTALAGISYASGAIYTNLPASYALTNGSLPGGISLLANGALTGTTPSVSTSTSYGFEVTATPTNTSLAAIARQYSITVVPSLVDSVDPYSQQVVFEAHLRGPALSDLFGNTLNVSPYPPVFSTERSIFNTQSLYIGNNPFYLSDQPQFNLAATDFTLEFWANFRTLPSTMATLVATKYFTFGYQANALTLALTLANATQTTLNFAWVADKAYNNFALVKAAGAFSVFVNGTQMGSAVTVGVLAINSSDTNLYFGASALSGSNAFGGFMAEARLTLAARYGGNYSLPIIPVYPDLPVIQTTIGTQYGGLAVNIQLSATDPYQFGQNRFSLLSGSLPPSLTLSASGLLSGTLANPGMDTSYPFQIAVTDGINTTETSYTVLVRNYTPPAWNTQSGSLGSITSGHAFTAILSATGQYSLTYALTAGSLPAGLSLSSTGSITGTPPVTLTTSTSSFTIAVSDGVLATAQTFSITVVANNPPVWNTTAGALAATSGGASYSQTVMASDPEGQSVTYSIASGTLPAGLSLNATTGVISGTVVNPPTSQTSSFILRASNGYTSSTLSLSIAVTAINPPVISSTGPGSVLGNAGFSYQFAASDPQGLPISFALVAGSGLTGLPANTALSASGLLSGTPPNPTSYNSTDGSPSFQYSFAITATNGIATSAASVFTLTVYVAQTPQITAPPAGSIGTFAIGAAVSLAIIAQDVDGFPLTYSVAAGTLPAGLMLGNATGVIAGTIANIATDTIYGFTVSASNGELAASRAYSILATAFPAPSWTTPAGSLGATNAAQPFATTLLALSNLAVSYAIVTGTLPSGLALNGTTGVIAGTVVNPVANYTASFIAGASDGYLTTNRSFAITVNQVTPPTWNDYELANGVIYPVGQSTPIVTNFANVYNNLQTLPSLSVAPYVTDALGLPLTFSTTSSLPDGVSLTTAGAFTGTIANDNASGTYGVAVIASNGIFSNTQTWYLRIAYIAPPNWNTPAGSLGAITGGVPVGLAALSTTDPNGLSVSYTVSAGSLPVGLTLSTAGVFTGTAANPGSNTSYNFTVVASNGVQGAAQAFSITVLANTPPVWITPAGALGTYASAIVIPPLTVLANSATSDTLNYVLANGSTLSAGLSLGIANGVISGTTGIVQSNTISSFVINAVEVDGVNAPVGRSFSITVLAYSQAVFTTPAGSLGNVIGGHGFAYSISATDPHSLPLTYSISAGSLPANLSLAANSGLISGTTINPVANTVYGFTVSASDGVAAPTTRAFSIAVITNTPPAFVDGSAYANTVSGFASFDHVFTAIDQNGQGVAYSIASGTLPSGLSFNGSNGEVSGIVANPGPGGASYGFAIAASNGYLSATLPASLSVTYYAPPTWNGANGALGSYFNASPFDLLSTATDPNGGTLTYALTQGSLPAGLLLNASTGEIKGTFAIVTNTVSATFYITAYNAHLSAQQPFTVTVNPYPAPTWVTPAGSLGSLYGGDVFAANVVATDNGITVAYSVVAGSLPMGLLLSSAGAISGTAANPTSNTVSNFTIAASNGYTTTNRAFSITVAVTLPPNWVTAANLGTIYPTTSVAFPLVAVDPRGLAVSYQADPNNTILGTTLPAGLLFNAANATIYGSIANPASTGSFAFTVDATNGVSTNAQTFTAQTIHVSVPNMLNANGSLGSVAGLGLCAAVPLEMNFEGPVGVANSTTLLDNQGHVLNLVGSVSLSNTVVLVGLTSGSFNGGYVTLVPHGSEFALGSGDFTLEVSLYFTSFNGAATGYNSAIIQQWASNNFSWSLSYISGGGAPQFGFKYSTDGQTAIYVNAVTTLSLNTWYRVAVVRYGGTLTFYLNGTAISSSSISAILYPTAASVVIGFDNVGNGSFFFGYMDELRLTVGLARIIGSLYTPSPYPFKTYTVANPVAIDPAGYALTYTISSGALPSGISMNATTGMLSGSYVNVSTATTYPFTITATNTYLYANSGAYSITVMPENAPVWLTNSTSLGSSLAGFAFANTVVARDPEYSVLYSLAAGSLPAGLMLNATTGVISGLASNPNGINLTSSFTLAAGDGYLSNTFNTAITVLYNIPPFINLAPNSVLGIWQGGQYHATTITASDPNGANLAISFTASLPAGLSISTTGVISGTIAQPAVPYANVAASVTATNGTASNTVFFYIGEQQTPSPNWQTPAGSLGNAIENYPLVTTLSASDPSGLVITYSITSGSLPAGLILNAVSGVIAGTPAEGTAAGTYSFIANAFNTIAANARSFFYTVVANFPPVWVTTTLPVGFSTESYANTVVAQDQTGLNQPISYSLVAGTLPAGLSLSNTGVLAGTLATVVNTVTSTFTLAANDIGGTTNQSFNLTVSPYVAPTWNTAPGSLGTVIGGHGFSVMLGATDHEGLGLTYVLANGSTLPAGLTLANTGLISGTTINPAANTTTGFSVTAQDQYGANTQSFTITVDHNLAPIFTNAGLLARLYGGNTITAASNVAVLAYDVYNQSFSLALANATSLPAGLTLNATTGVITGSTSNPAGNTVTSFVVSANNAYYVSYQNYSIEIDQVLPPVFITNAGTIATYGSNTTALVTISAIDPQNYPITYALTSGSLPPGLSASANGANYVITGITPNLNTTTSYGFVLSASDEVANASASFTITVNAVPAPGWVTTAGSLGTVLGGYYFANTVTAIDNGYSISYTVTSGSLPAGLALGVANGVIFGVATNPSNVQNATSFVITASDGYTSAPQSFSINVLYNAPPVFTDLSAGQVVGPFYGGVANAYTVTATDANNQALTFYGSLPTGLTIANTGVIAGTIAQPNAVQNVAASVSVTNGISTNTVSFYILETPAPIPSWVSPPAGALGNGVANYPIAPITLVATQAGLPLTYTVISGSLPNGLALTNYTNTAVISGTLSETLGSNCIFQPNYSLSNDLYASNVVVLMHFDADFSDIQGHSTTISSSPAPIISNSVSAAGTGSAYISNGANIQVNYNPNFGANAWTMELSVNLTSVSNGATYYFLTQDSAATPGNWGLTYQVDSYGNGTLTWTQGNPQYAAADLTGAITFALNTWYTLAVEWDTRYVTTFVNGTALISSSSNVGAYNFSGLGQAQNVNVIVIGNDASGLHNMTGYVDEFRLTIGVARYATSAPYNYYLFRRYPFTIAAANGAISNSRSFTYVVEPNGPPIFTAVALPTGFGNEIYTGSVTATDFTGLNQAITYSLNSGSLPSGLSLAANGVISGTLSLVNTTTTSTFTVLATDGGGSAISNTCNIQVTPYVAPTWNTVSGSLGTIIGLYGFSVTVGATDHENLNITYALANGSTLPAGLTLSNATIAGIAANPASNTTTTFSIIASDYAGSNTQTFSITVNTNLPPIFTNAGLLTTLYGGHAVANIAVQAYDTNNQTLTYALANATTLPAALTLNAATGAITGTAANPAANTTTSFVVSASNGYFTNTQTYAITVNQTLAPVFVTAAGSLGSFASNTAVALSVQATDPQGYAITYALVSGSLPSGLVASTNAANYVIAGTTGQLSTANTATFAISATNGIATGTRTFSITVNAVPAPTWVTQAGSLGNALGGRSFASTLSATDPGYTVSYALTAGTLPAALTLNSITGAINGITTNPGAVQNATAFSVTASDGYTNAVQSFSIQVIYNAPPIINTAAGSLGSVYGGYYFSNTISAYDPTSYNQTLTFSISAGSLPAGISLNSSSGLIAGTATNPANSTTSSFTVTVTNGITAAQQAYSITVNNVTAPTWVTANSLGTYYQLQNINTTLVATDHNALPLAYVLSAGSLPAGLAISNTGVITGSVSNTATLGIDTFTVTAFDAVSNAAQAFSVNVASYVAPVWTTASGVIVSGVANTAVNTTVVATSPEGYSITYSVTSGTLPSTLMLSSTGLISGTLPNTGGTYAVFIGAFDSYTTVSRSFSFVVMTYMPVWITSSLPTGQGLVAYATVLVASYATSYAIISGSLPSGLSLNAATGVISGTPPNVIGGTQSSFVVQASNIYGTANQSFVLLIIQNAGYDPYSEAVVLSMPMIGSPGANAGAAFVENLGHTVNIIGAPYVNTVVTYNGLNETPAVYFPIGSYFSIPVAEEFIFEANDYTVEWSSIGVQGGQNLMFAGTATGSYSVFTLLSSNLDLAPFGSTTQAIVLTFSASGLTNAWFSYAFVKHGNTLSYYVNGNLAATATANAIATLATPGYVLIGGINASTTMMNFRITNGAARYNGNYTVPTTLPTYPAFAAPQNTLLGTFINGVYGTANVVASGYNLVYMADGLPAGMTINATTGVISGTPSGYASLGTTQLITTVTVQDGLFNNQTRDFLIAVNAPPVADTQGGNTVLLMHANGANAANSFAESLGHTIIPYAGNAVTSNIYATGGLRPFGGSALSLNGSSSIQVIPFGNEFSLGNNDFTIEFDIYMATLPSASYPIGVATVNPTGTAINGWAFGVLNSTALGFTYSASGSSVTTLSFATTLVAATWYNICAVRKNNSLTIYVNGSQISSAQTLPAMQPYNGNLFIGSTNGYYLTGALSEIRITNGYARYSGPSYQISQAQFANPIYWPAKAAISGVANSVVSFNLTPTEPYGAALTVSVSGLPSGLSATNGVVNGTLGLVTTDTNYQVIASATSAYSASQKTYVLTNYATPMVDAYGANVTCFMNFSGLNASNTTNQLYNPAFVEQTGFITGVVASYGNPTIITGAAGAGAQYSSAALYLNGSSGLALTAASNTAFSLGANDFTIECNINLTVANASTAIVGSAANTATLSWSVSYTGSALQFSYSNSGTSFVNIANTWAPTAATWYQIAVVRKASLIYMFVNGNQLGSANTVSANLYPVSTSQIGYTAQTGSAASFLQGYISELRITNGFGRYTTAYTPAVLTAPVAWSTAAGNLTTIIGGNTL